MKKELFHQMRRKIAKLWLDINLQLTVVGVTGSYGKTSTVRAIAEVLSAQYSVNRTDLNLDTVYNLPITILKTKIWNEVLVLEYGVDHKNEMDFHLSLVKPKIVVFTGITPVHSDEEHLGSLENIISEKRKLIEAVPENGFAVFNFDDENVRKIGQDFKGKKFFYGLDKEADVWADKVKVSLAGTEFELHDGQEKFFLKTGLLGYPAVYTCLAAYVVSREEGVKREKIIEKLVQLEPLPGRLSVEPGPRGTVLIDDSRRANPASTISGLKSFAQFPGRKVAVLGEMGELGVGKEKRHQEVGEKAAELGIDLIVGVGPLTKNILEGARKKGLRESQLFWARDVIEAAEILGTILKKDDLFYLKASLLRHLERIVFLLEGEKVCCTVVVCHHYDSCPTCPQFKKCLK